MTCSTTAAEARGCLTRLADFASRRRVRAVVVWIPRRLDHRLPRLDLERRDLVEETS